jgi:6-phosphogluconate dehydrogenase
VSARSMSAEVGRCSDSGEGRRTAIAAIDESVLAPEPAIALSSGFRSRDLVFCNHVLSAVRKQFGGHDEPAR